MRAAPSARIPTIRERFFFFQQRHVSLGNSCLHFLRTGTLSTLYLLSGLLLPITPCGSCSHRRLSSSTLQPSPHHGCVPNGSSVYLCESRSCSVLTVCGTPVGREKVSVQVMLLRVGLATLGLVCLYLNSLWAGAHSASRSKMRGACPGASLRHPTC